MRWISAGLRFAPRPKAAAVICALLVTAVAPNVVLAEVDKSQWICTGGQCVARAAPAFVSVSGTFLHGAGLDGATDADRIAALEQQSLRAFEYVINDPIRLSVHIGLDPSYQPEDWPDAAGSGSETVTALIWRSEDGETYGRIAEATDLKSGDMVLVGIRQPRSGPNSDNVTYFPARWTAVLSAHRLRPDRDWGGDAPPFAPPSLISADTDPVPEDIDATAPVSVAGAADPGNPTAPCLGAECVSPAPVTGPIAPALASELGLELQSELARVGCYPARVDGLWGPASRRAMQDFNAKASVALPVANPTARALVVVSQSPAPVCSTQ